MKFDKYAELLIQTAYQFENMNKKYTMNIL